MDVKEQIARWDELSRKELGEALIDCIQQPRFGSLLAEDLYIVLQSVLDAFAIKENSMYLKIPETLRKEREDLC